MKTQLSVSTSLIRVALITILILLVPFTAMLVTEEVKWKIGDFIIMGILIFVAGTAYVIVTRQFQSLVYRIAIACALGTTFLMIWANLAVGLIGSGPHVGNIMYAGVIVIGTIGTFLSRFKSTGLERTMYAMTGGVAVITIIALVTGMQNYPESSATEILAVNGFFAILFIVTGLLFRYESIKSVSKPI